MTGSFEDQTKGVPRDLLKQGYRLCPDEASMWLWVNESSLHRWDVIQLEDGLRIARPTMLVRQAPSARYSQIYAHQGWGEGLAPTHEMVHVWPYWWSCSGLYGPHPVMVFGAIQMWWQGTSDAIPREVTPASVWRGPVLPPQE